jgi:ketosteroid isomerase-like protein
MTTAESGLASALVDAILAQHVTRVVALLHPDVSFRAMTPNRFWEADGAAGVEAIFREWFEDPDEEIHGVEATEPVAIVETMRVGWLVRISDADGPHVFEQQAYVTERDGQIDWMRVMCSGWIPLTESSP